MFVDQDGGIIFAVIRATWTSTRSNWATPCAPRNSARPRRRAAAAGIATATLLPSGSRGESGGGRLAGGRSQLVAGANRAGFHYRNANFPRDFRADLVTDIALARQGDTCSVCGGELADQRGIELGHIFKLGTKYSQAMGATYLDPDGQEKPIVMGCYGIGIGRLMAAAIEQHNDYKGIIRPPAIAPCQVHVVGLNLDRAEIAEAAESVYESLGKRWEVLYDERSEQSAGVKFNDADLLGLPVRVTVSARSLKAGGAEVKARWAAAAVVVPLERLEEAVEASLACLPGPH